MLMASLLAALVISHSDAPAHHNAVWVQPVGTAVGAATNLVFVPVGVTLQGGAHADWFVEAAPVYGNWYGCHTHQVGAFASLGASWHPWSHGLTSGAFFGARLNARTFLTPDSGSGMFCDVPSGTELEAGPGLEGGYQTVLWRRLHLALKLGASVNWCQNCLGHGFLPEIFGSGRSSRFTLGLDLNVLRVGFAW